MNKPVFTRLPLAVAMLAVFSCLWASTQFHSHEQGLHTFNPCINCSLEDLASHGAVPVEFAGLESLHLWTAALMLQERFVFRCSSLGAVIRAPPALS